MTASPQGGVTQLPVKSRPTPARGQFLRARATLGRGRNRNRETTQMTVSQGDFVKLVEKRES